MVINKDGVSSNGVNVIVNHFKCSKWQATEKMRRGEGYSYDEQVWNLVLAIGFWHLGWCSYFIWFMNMNKTAIGERGKMADACCRVGVTDRPRNEGGWQVTVESVTSDNIWEFSHGGIVPLSTKSDNFALIIPPPPQVGGGRLRLFGKIVFLSAGLRLGIEWWWDEFFVLIFVEDETR